MLVIIVSNVFVESTFSTEGRVLYLFGS